MATAGSLSVVSGTYVTLFDPKLHGNATTIAVWVPADTTVPCFVHVSNLHLAADAGFPLRPGMVDYFTVFPRGLGLVKVKPVGGTVVFNYGVVSKKVD